MVEDGPSAQAPCALKGTHKKLWAPVFSLAQLPDYSHLRSEPVGWKISLSSDFQISKNKSLKRYAVLPEIDEVCVVSRAERIHVWYICVCLCADEQEVVRGETGRSASWRPLVEKRLHYINGPPRVGWRCPAVFVLFCF